MLSALARLSLHVHILNVSGVAVTTVWPDSDLSCSNGDRLCAQHLPPPRFFFFTTTVERGVFLILASQMEDPELGKLCGRAGV